MKGAEGEVGWRTRAVPFSFCRHAAHGGAWTTSSRVQPVDGSALHDQCHAMHASCEEALWSLASSRLPRSRPRGVPHLPASASQRRGDVGGLCTSETRRCDDAMPPVSPSSQEDQREWASPLRRGWGWVPDVPHTAAFSRVDRGRRFLCCVPPEHLTVTRHGIWPSRDMASGCHEAGWYAERSSGILRPAQPCPPAPARRAQ